MRPKDIRELVKIVESSTINELEITGWGGRKIRISKTAGSQLAVPQGEATGVVLPMQGGPATPSASQAEPAESSSEKSGADADDSFIEIQAPMVGTFYRASAPDAEPYIKEGDRISNGQVLCIIEAMKLMNEIEAEISGRIVKVLVENAQPVEYNQPLFLVEAS